LILICFCVLWVISTYIEFALVETNIHLQLYITLPAVGVLVAAAIFMRRKKLVLLILLCFVALLGSVSRFQSYEAGLSGDNLQSHSDTYATMQGVIAADPKSLYTPINIRIWKTVAISHTIATETASN